MVLQLELLSLQAALQLQEVQQPGTTTIILTIIQNIIIEGRI
jgi:hypothetical protein